MKESIEFEELKSSMIIIDSEDNIGTIVKCKDIRKIVIKYDGVGGYGFICLDPCVNTYEQIYVEKIENDLLVICKNCGQVIFKHKNIDICPICKNVLC